MSRYFLLILTILFTKHLCATAQYGDLLIIEGDTSWISANPLESYFERKGSRTIGSNMLNGYCTALWRGYVATWELEGDSLFLVQIQTNYCGDNPVEMDIVKEFHTDRVFAEWVNSTILKPEGELLMYVHAGYMSIYEGETFFRFKAGVLAKTEAYNYLRRDESLTFPGERFLEDTIRSMILKAVTISERENFNEDNSCTVVILFNDQGGVDSIGLGFRSNAVTLMQKTILSRTEEALKNFPKLMKVEHERYLAPIIEIWFDGHCLKHPFDREYGCSYE